MANFGKVLEDETRGEILALVKRVGIVKAGKEIGISAATLKFALGGCTISRLTRERLERWLEDVQIARSTAEADDD